MALKSEPYKGMRDFYPEDWAKIENLFNKAEKILKNLNYKKYNASPLERLEIYKEKSGDEIIKQIYYFQDKGGEEVALRPEMTQTLARMIARKTNLKGPIRWYSIPSVFRYERTQSNRKREHYQLNVDFWDKTEDLIDAEIVQIAKNILDDLGLKNNQDYKIIINDREIFNQLINKFEINKDAKKEIAKIFDKKEKISQEEFEAQLKNILKEKFNLFMQEIKTINKSQNLKNLEQKLDFDFHFNPFLIRGADYYNGIIFEIIGLKKDGSQTSSLIGGGRYDNIIKIFDAKRHFYSGGFGMGDLRLIELLEDKNLI